MLIALLVCAMMIALSVRIPPVRAWVSISTATRRVNFAAQRQVGQSQFNDGNRPFATTTTRLFSTAPVVRIPKRFVPFPFEVSYEGQGQRLRAQHCGGESLYCVCFSQFHKPSSYSNAIFNTTVSRGTDTSSGVAHQFGYGHLSNSSPTTSATS